jgi:hypothetical protein
MKKKLLFLLASVALVITLTSCTTFKATGLSSRGINDSYDVVGYMDETIHVSKFLGVSAGPVLLDLNKDAVSSKINSIVQEQLYRYGGDAIINMEIDHSASLFDILGNSLTFSIWAPSTTRITGSIIKYKKLDNSGQVFVNMK